MEKFLRSGTALLFNLFICVAVSAASGINPYVLLGVSTAAGALMGSLPSGSFGMAVQKEIWMNSIIEDLFADNSFLSKAYNADLFVNSGRTVHIPNAGAPSATVKNRTQKPATISERTDTDLTFNLDEYTTDPIHIPHADTVELSYNKRESVLKQDKSALQDVVASGFLFSWSPASANCIKTTGESVTAHTDGATGSRKSFDKADVLSAMTRFNRDNIPQEGRHLLLDAVMYSQLLKSLTANESQAFHSLVDVKNGILGRLYGFNVMMRSRALRYTGGGNAKEWTTGGSGTDCAAALAWHTNSVCRALGEVRMFENESDPTYYGDIYSFLVRAGGRPMRADVKGLIGIVQDTDA